MAKVAELLDSSGQPIRTCPSLKGKLSCLGYHVHIFVTSRQTASPNKGPNSNITVTFTAVVCKLWFKEPQMFLKSTHLKGQEMGKKVAL